MKELIGKTLRKFGYRLERWRPGNRFSAMRETLEMLGDRGFEPRVIIDGGANVGQWFTLAVSAFPAARFEIVEPVPACHLALDRVAAGYPRATVHKLALTAPGSSTVSMAGGSHVGCTGSFASIHEFQPPRSAAALSSRAL